MHMRATARQDARWGIRGRKQRGLKASDTLRIWPVSPCGNAHGVDGPFDLFFFQVKLDI